MFLLKGRRPLLPPCVARPLPRGHSRDWGLLGKDPDQTSSETMILAITFALMKQLYFFVLM